MLCVMRKGLKRTSFVENDNYEKKPCILWYYFEFILKTLYHCFQIQYYLRTIEKAQVYSYALKSSDVSWYHDIFGMMHRYSCILYHPISILDKYVVMNMIVC